MNTNATADTIKEATTRTGRFGHFTLDGVTTICGRNDVIRSREVTGVWPSGRPMQPIADCRNCNAKINGSRRCR